MLTYNSYNILSSSIQEKKYKNDILIYLPQEYIPTILKICRVQLISYSSIVTIKYNNISNKLSFEGNKNDVNEYTTFIKNILENTFMNIMLNEFGNIGRWSDI